MVHQQEITPTQKLEIIIKNNYNTIQKCQQTLEHIALHGPKAVLTNPPPPEIALLVNEGFVVLATPKFSSTETAAYITTKGYNKLIDTLKDHYRDNIRQTNRKNIPSAIDNVY